MNQGQLPDRFRTFKLLCLTVLVGLFLFSGVAEAKKVNLFNALEFRGSLKSLSAWKRIINKGRRQAQQLHQCTLPLDKCSPAGRSWQQMRRKAERLKGREQLIWVNRFFNRWPYRLDRDLYGRSDYWAVPFEFLRNSGDCEDYAITKYWALRQLGISADRLRIVVVLDSIRRIGHAVLAVYVGNEVYILDNMSDMVFSHTRYTHYIPQYSVNEKFRWAYIKLKRTR